jgi:hypothetical protein
LPVTGTGLPADVTLFRAWSDWLEGADIIRSGSHQDCNEHILPSHLTIFVKSRSAKKKTPRRSPRAALTKEKLLPPTAGSVRETSLRNHLALAACRSTAGNTTLLGELFIVASLSWFLREAGFGDEPDSFYYDVQAALERCVALTVSNETWSIESVDEAILAGLLCFYDQQFAAAPVYVMDGARKRMQQLAKGEWLFPWPGRG